MKKTILSIAVFLFIFFSVIGAGDTTMDKKEMFSLEGLGNIYLSQEAKELLRQNGFVVTPGDKDEIYDVYAECKEYNQPIFVTTDAVLHISHIFFDYILRILEIEKLYDVAVKLTDRMLDLSIKQYNEARDAEVKEAARLNIGFFAVAKKEFNPEYEVGFGLANIVEKETGSIESHAGLEFRELLTYVENPSLMMTPYAYEDYSQYVPRGHYTRNEKFRRYFKTLMWYGRIDFKLKPGKGEPALTHGRKMTLQALLMTDALLKNKETHRL